MVRTRWLIGLYRTLAVRRGMLALVAVCLAVTGATPATAAQSGRFAAGSAMETPATSVAYGRQTVRIDQATQVQVFVDALATPNTTILLADHVELDLSGRQYLDVMPGVHIIGRRSSTNSGPRLFTTTKPAVLLRIGSGYEYHHADGVRISGIRLDGGNLGIAGASAPGPIGISVNSSVNIEIANNEIYGWAGIGVQVLDDQQRISLANATAVRIHDNYIHHNRHWRQQGYGVQANSGAYVLIERNVFDYNRHAIEASNTDGIGYLAYANLVLENGGENCCYGVPIQYTHQFDVHGTDTCGFKTYYCGEAGEYFDYRYNGLAYTSGDALKIRGEPDIGADVASNVFAKCAYGEAIVQTDGNNLKDHGNNQLCRFSELREVEARACDFDADGYPDDFRSTGSTWWFRGATRQWQHLNTEFGSNWDSQAEDLLEFRDVDGDGHCDVRHRLTGKVFGGGRSNWLVNGTEAALKRTDLVWQAAEGGGATVWELNSTLSGVARTRNLAILSGQRIVATGDFNADGNADVLTRSAAGQIAVVLLDQRGTAIAPIGDRSPIKGSVPSATSLAGTGDFNDDGRSDLLWRHGNGQLVIWFAGESGNSAKVSWNNETDTNGAPADDPAPNLAWQVKGVADFDGDGFSDILWRHEGGQVAIWFMVHGMHVGDAYPGTSDPQRLWAIQGIGDFDGDQHSDVLWRHNGGALAIWRDGQYDTGWRPSWENRPGWVVGQDWTIKSVGDFSADGKADILWRHDDGTVSIWRMNGGSYLGESARLPMDNEWSLRALGSQRIRTLFLQ
ncbi:right-handed parallel beta-helix repeat-containing protein [Kribbella deserti]|uniref:Right-handed parallel beta-helix repeat-containing protein n=1 Tax=Kribbella deserti TaxID=1926257 RepID=A0ABV6QN29_9ACTN